MRKPKIYTGYIANNNEIERPAKMVVIGDYADGAMCYMESDENGEIIDEQTTYIRKIVKYDGKNISIFF